MIRLRAFTVQSRSDQDRAIESRDEYDNATTIAQYRKETEFSELNDG
jgi:hypothetical protein